MSTKKNRERKRKQRTTTRAHSNGGGMATIEEEPSVNCENQANPPKHDLVFARAEPAVRKTVAWIAKINASPGVNQWFTKTIEKPSNESENLVDPERKAKMRSGENGFTEATRVTLKGLTDPTKDFINANYINGPHWNRSYICTQHPTEATFEDFWRMVYHENVENIIAIFSPEEKLPYYFPKETGGYMSHGLFFVNCRRVISPTQRFTPIQYFIEVLPEGCSNSHIVTILHCAQWQKDKFPETSRAIIKMLLKIKGTEKGANAPIVVHSALGTNRSGCVIFVDTTADLMFRNFPVDVPAHVKRIRTMRAGIISNPQTFVFGICAVLEYVKGRLRKIDGKHDLMAEIERLLERLEKDFADLVVKEDDKKKTETVDVNENEQK